MFVNPPPRSITKSPTFEVPSGAADCHCHIVGPESQYPYVANRSFTPVDCLPDDYLRMQKTLGVERMVIVQPSFYGSDNSRTMSAVAAFGKRSRAVCMVGQNVDDKTLRELADGGCRGIRFMAVSKGGPTLDDLPVVAKKIAPFGLHIEMYIPYQNWPQVLPMISDLPVPVVLDHIAGLPADMAENDPIMVGILKLMESGRCWVKLCAARASVMGPPFTDVEVLAKRFVSRGRERCVWGSDWPHTNTTGEMPDDGEMMDLLKVWAPDAASRRKILVDNPAALYGF
jgi:predicted TIM-barrel fold metal-dependent hydrolase